VLYCVVCTAKYFVSNELSNAATMRNGSALSSCVLVVQVSVVLPCKPLNCCSGDAVYALSSVFALRARVYQRIVAYDVHSSLYGVRYYEAASLSTRS
jgi:hypothetical protein